MAGADPHARHRSRRVTVRRDWQRRAEIGTHIAAGGAARRALHRARWDLIVDCLNGGAAYLSPFATIPSSAGLGLEQVDTRAALAWDAGIQHLLHQHEQRADRLEEYAVSLRDALEHEKAERDRKRLALERDIAVLRAEVAATRDELEQAQGSAATTAERDRERLSLERDIALLRAEAAATRDELEQAQRSAAAARDLAGRLHAQLDRGPTPAVLSAEVAALRRALEATLKTKLFRWSAPMRRVYDRITE